MEQPEVRQKRKYVRKVKPDAENQENQARVDLALAADILTVETVTAKAKLADMLARKIVGLLENAPMEEIEWRLKELGLWTPPKQH